MKQYQAWIKTITPLVYDNSKSIFQIISELMPMLVEFQTVQIDFAEDMDKTKGEIEEVISKIPPIMNEFTNTFTEKLIQYRTEYYSGKNELINSIEIIKNNFISTLNNDIETFKTAYANKKQEISELVTDAETSLPELIVQSLGGYYEELNNILPDYMTNGFLDTVYVAINQAYGETYQNNQIEIWKELNEVSAAAGTGTPTNAGLYAYNTTTNTLYYSVNNGALNWQVAEIIPNGLYKYNNQLYQGKLDKMYNTSDILVATTGSISRFIGKVDNIVYGVNIITNSSGNKVYSIRVFDTSQGVNSYTSYTIETLPSDFRDSIGGVNNNMCTLQGFTKLNDTYYCVYQDTSYTYKVMKSIDLINWVTITEISSTFTGVLRLRLLDNTVLVDNSDTTTYFIDENSVVTPLSSIKPSSIIQPYIYGKHDDYYLSLVYNTSNRRHRLVQSSDMKFTNFSYVNNVIYDMSNASNRGMSSIFYGKNYNIIGNYIMNLTMTEGTSYNNPLIMVNNYLSNGYNFKHILESVIDLIPTGCLYTGDSNTYYEIDPQQLNSVFLIETNGATSKLVKPNPSFKLVML